MNVLLNFIIIFLFIVLVISMNIPNTDKSNYMLNKLYLFLGITILQIIILLADKMSNKCKLTTKEIIREATKYGLLAVVGYSLYVDIIFSPTLSEKYVGYITVPKKNLFFLTSIISGFILGYKIIDNILLPLECST